MKVLSVVGARPNFMKLAPVARALAARDGATHIIVHTGQHYDASMSDDFFRDLGIPAPDYNLEVGSASHAQQTAAIMQGFEGVCLKEQPDIVLVYGDVNSTVAAALVAAKLGARVAHVEAGLRSRDWSMPEEINRVVTDRLSDLLFTPSRDGNANLAAEGVAADRVHFVGNVMIDSLVRALPAARERDAARQHGVQGGAYAVVTLHRPSNVDVAETSRALLGALTAIARELPVVFPMHPRTRQRWKDFGLNANGNAGLRIVEPLNYLDMLGLVAGARLVVTDSGGLQEETSYLGVPCLTVRPSTERPVTCSHGTNRLVTDPGALLAAARDGLSRGAQAAAPIERWDGKAAERIAAVLLDGATFT